MNFVFTKIFKGGGKYKERTGDGAQEGRDRAKTLNPGDKEHYILSLT